MIIITLVSILFVKSFAKNNDHETFMDIKHPMWRFDDQTGNISNSSMLGVCYGWATQWLYYPYIVQLQSSACVCSGSIISTAPAVILTAAHCSDCASFVYVGCRNPRNCNINEANVFRYTVQSGSFTTWGYNSNTKSNDIAVLRLNTAIVFPSAAEAVQLNGNVGLNSNVNRVIGYGVDQTGDFPTLLQTGTTQFVSQSTCQRRYGSFNIDSSMICVQDPSHSVPNPGVTTCGGDSGGPWTDAADRQYGVSSFGWGPCAPYRCDCCPEIPQVGANVAHFISQICSRLAQWGGNNIGCPRS